MKSKLLLLLSLLSAYTVSAQLVITPDAQFSIMGNIPVSLQNIDFVNDGIFTPGNSMVTFTGNVSSSISGNRFIQFYELETNKTNASSVILQRAIGVTHRILFTSGFIELNGFDTDLGTTGRLDGEQENSRITGTNGGEVLFSTILNAPAGANPGNLGAIISSAQNLRNVIIKRGHQSQVIGSGTGNSLLRYYDITPLNNTGPDATIRFNYFNGELNGLNENSLAFFKSDNAIDWSGLGFTSRDSIANFVEKPGIGSFSRLTLARLDNPLPVHFILFNAKCEERRALITWKTAQEQNSDHFDVEKSTDGIRWTVIGNLPAAGNSNAEKNYFITDNNTVQTGYYRIAEYDVDGKVQYSSTVRSSCTVTDAFSLWPNPAHETVFINIVTGNKSQAVIKVFDSKGALVQVRKETVVQGNNQLRVDIKSLANGPYSFYIEWNNGQMSKTVQVMKQ